MFIDDTYLKKVHKKTVSIAFIMMAVPFVLAILGVFALKTIISDEPLAIYGTLKYILIALTAIEIVLMIVFKNQIISGTINLEPKNQKQKRKKQDVFVDRLFTSTIIIFSVCNSIAIYGLALYLLGHDVSILLGFMGSSFFLMMAQYPKKEDWESHLKQFIEDEADESFLAKISGDS
jgi:hypothetical protein